jgi:hypothetical protein
MGSYSAESQDLEAVPLYWKLIAMVFGWICLAATTLFVQIPILL